MLPEDIDTLAKLLLNADSPKPGNHPGFGRTAADETAAQAAGTGNLMPAGTGLQSGRIPSELARFLRSLQAGARIPYTAQGGNNG
jgi:hypothetical protein